MIHYVYAKHPMLDRPDKTKGRVAAHAQAEPGGVDWDDDEAEAQQEPGEGAAPGRWEPEGLGQEAALSEGAAEGDFDVPLVGGH